MDIQKLLDEYTNWLKKEITISQYGEYYELTIPYLDRFNDYLQIYVKQDIDGKITMTDDGYIIQNLISSGFNILSSDRRKQAVDRVIKNFDLRLNGNEIVSFATEGNFAQKKHFLVQAMLEIDNMFELNPGNVGQLFSEDVKMFFDSNRYYYSEDISILGKSGIHQKFEFLFQKTAIKPERFCKAVNYLDSSARAIVLFNWIDVVDKRGTDSELIVFINDIKKCPSDSDTNALDSYGIKPVLFSQRDAAKDLFAA